MRVGYVLKRYPRYSETFIVNEILAHEAAGLEIEIFALRAPSDTHFQDSIARVRAPVTYIPRRALNVTALWDELREARDAYPASFDSDDMLHESASTVHQSLLLAQEVRARGIDHLHAHFGTVATAVARLTSRLIGVPYSFTAHAKDIFHESVQHDYLERKLRDAATVVTVSDYNARYLRKEFNAAAAKVVRVYNGLNLDSFQYQSPVERPPLILGVGRLVEKKGFSHLLEACAELIRLERNFRCRIIGTGELEGDLRARIDGLGIGHAVELAGARPQSEVIQQVQGSAVLAVPCVVGEDGNRDGLPTVLLEAMALGTPCVSTGVTGIPEVIRDGQTGLVVPQRDAKGLARALDRLLTDAPMRVRLAEGARCLIEAQFDVHTSTRRLREVFSEAGLSDGDAADAAV